MKKKLAKLQSELTTGEDVRNFEFDIAIVGGLGHVGLPLGIALADKEFKVCLIDLDSHKAEMVNKGIMPFVEYGAEPILKRVIGKNLFISLEKEPIARAKNIIICIGTPVDEYLNPTTRPFFELLENLKPYLTLEQNILIRSTVFPRTCRQAAAHLGKGDWKIAYCPERIVQGYAIQELGSLPQIIAGLTHEATEAAVQIFGKLSPKIIRASVEEAELVKLFSNAWRYIQFAAANQFFMMSQNFGVDFNRVRKLMMDGYGRASSLPTAGFAAGPCLLKDTMQLAAFNNNNFYIGHAAMMINEGLPNFIVEELRRRYVLSCAKVGILGMAFKGDVDDIRDSLSYKLGKILRFHGAKVLYSDEFASDPTFITKEKLLEQADIVIIGAPHSAYQGLKFSRKLEVIDLWGVIQKPSLEWTPADLKAPVAEKTL